MACHRPQQRQCTSSRVDRSSEQGQREPAGQGRPVDCCRASQSPIWPQSTANGAIASQHLGLKPGNLAQLKAVSGIAATNKDVAAEEGLPHQCQFAQ